MLSAGNARVDSLVKKVCGDVPAGQTDNDCTAPLTTPMQNHVTQLSGNDQISQFAVDSYLNGTQARIDDIIGDCAAGQAAEAAIAAAIAQATLTDTALIQTALEKARALAIKRTSCARDEFIRSNTSILDAENAAFQSALTIKQGIYTLKDPTSASAQFAKTVFTQADFDALYQRASAALGESLVSNFDNVLLGAALEKQLSGPQAPSFRYRGRTFDTLGELMTHASVVAQDVTSGARTIESLGLPTGLLIALYEVLNKDYGTSAENKRDILNLAGAMYHEAVADIMAVSGASSAIAASAIAASEFYGDAVARLINSTLTAERAKQDNTVDKEIAALRTALSTQYLVLGTNATTQATEAQLEKFPAALTADTAAPANLDINLHRLWREAVKAAPQGSDAKKVAEAVIAAVTGLRIDDANGRASRLSQMRADKVTAKQDGSFDVTLAVATETPEWLRLKLGVTDDPRKVALDYVWKQVTTATLPGKRKPEHYLEDLAKKLKPYSQGANSLLRVIVKSFNSDGSLVVIQMPTAVHEKDGRSILDMRNNDAVAAALFNRHASELYLKTRSAKQGFNDSANSVDSMVTASSVSSTLATALKVGPAEPYLYETAKWENGLPVLGKKEVPTNPFSFSADLSISFINDRTALLATFKAGRRFGAGKNDAGLWFELGAELALGNQIKKTAQHRHDLLAGPSSEPNVVVPATSTGLSLTAGRNFKAEKSRNLVGIFGGIGVPVDDLFSVSGGGRYARYAEDGSPYFSVTLSDRIGKSLSFNPDWVLTSAAGTDRFVLGDYANIIRLSAEWAALGESLSLTSGLGYMTNFGDAPEKILFDLGSTSALPKKFTLTTKYKLDNTLDAPASINQFTAGVERPIGLSDNLTLSLYLSGMAMLVGGTTARDPVEPDEDVDVVVDPSDSNDDSQETPIEVVEQKAPDTLANISTGGKLNWKPSGGPLGLYLDLGGDLLGPGYEDTLGIHAAAGLEIEY